MLEDHGAIRQPPVFAPDDEAVFERRFDLVINLLHPFFGDGLDRSRIIGLAVACHCEGEKNQAQYRKTNR